MSKDFKVKNGLQVTTNITASGNISASGTITGLSASLSSINLADNEKIKIGTGEDLQIFHDGTDAFITDAGGTHLRMHTNQLIVKNAAGGEQMIKATQNEGVKLFHNNQQKFETKIGGIEVTGNITASGDISSSGTITMLTASIGGGIFTSASLAAGGGGGGSMDNFTLTADGGSNQTIADGNTLDIAGGTNITTAVGATDTVTVNLDASPSITNLTASGNISASGEIQTKKIQFPIPTSTTANGIFFKDTSSNAPHTNINVIQWDFSNDDAFIYAHQSSSDGTYLVNELRDNTSTDKFVWWFNNFAGKTTDSFPLMLEGNKAVINYHYDKRTTFHRDSGATNGPANNVDFFLLKSGSTSVSTANSLIHGDVSAGKTTLNDIVFVDGNITASGNISASGTITAEQITSTDDMTVTDDLIVGGTISASGKITGDDFEFNLPTDNGRKFRGLTNAGVRLHDSSGGWAMAYGFQGNDERDLGGFGAFGGGSLEYFYVGNHYQRAVMTIHSGSTNGVMIGSGIGETDPPKTLTVAGEISASGNITTPSTGSVGNLIATTIEGTLSDSSRTDINSILATDLVLGEDAQTKIDFGTANIIKFFANNSEKMTISDTGVVIDGDITAQQYIVNSTVTNVTQSFSSGSTIFGDTPADDTHQFTGSVSVTGSFTANTVDINGGTLDGITSLTVANNIDIGSHGFRALQLQDDSLTNTRVVFAGSNGVLSDDSKFTFASNKLSTPSLSVSHSSAGGIGLSIEQPTTAVVTARFDSDRFRFWAGGSERLTILSASGNIGIGTSAPVSALHVEEGDIRIDTANNGTQALRFSDRDTTKVQIQYKDSDETLNILTGGSTNAIEITNAQNVKFSGPITASGDISASGTITSNGGTFTGDTTFGGHIILNADNRLKSDTTDSHNFLEFDDDSGSPENQTILSSVTNVALIVDGNGNDTGQFEVLKAGTGSTATELFRIENDGDTVLDGDFRIQSGHKFNVAGNDVLDQTTLGSTVVNSSLTNVGTLTGLNVNGNITASGNISASGELSANTVIVGSTISHIGDTNTLISFGTDTLTFKAGNESFITITEDGSQDNIVIGDGGDIDFHVKAGGDNTLFVQGSSQRVGIGLNSPSTILHVKSDDNQLARFESNDDDAKIIIKDNDTTGFHNVRDGFHSFGFDGFSLRSPLFVVSGSQDANGVHGKVGIGTKDVSDSVLTVLGDISASGDLHLTDITASGIIIAEHLSSTDDAEITDDLTVGGDINVGQSIFHDGDTDTKIAFTTDVITFTAGNEQLLQLSEGGQDQVIIGDGGDVDFHVKGGGSNTLFVQGSSQNVGVGTNTPGEKLEVAGNISGSGEIFAKVGQHRFEKTSNTDADAKGDVVFLGGTTSMDAGKIYHYKSDGTWELADADAVATSDGLLAVALGAASDVNGMLLRGTVTLDHDPGAVGDVLFLSTTAGQATATAPSGNTDIVRVIGYCLDASNGQIWFNPDSAFVEVSA